MKQGGPHAAFSDARIVELLHRIDTKLAGTGMLTKSEPSVAWPTQYQDSVTVKPHQGTPPPPPVESSSCAHI